MAVSRVISDEAKRRVKALRSGYPADPKLEKVDALRRGYPTFDRGVVPDEDMQPSAVRRALHADKTGEVGKMQGRAEVRMGGKGKIERVAEPAPKPKKRKRTLDRYRDV